MQTEPTPVVLNDSRRIWTDVASLILLALLLHSAAAADLQTRNLFLVTTDGLRWQELFGGADAGLLNEAHGGVKNTNTLQRQFWRETHETRREALMPFFWSVIATQGQVLGNTNIGSAATVINGLNFSYPGYNELLAGIADPRIDSNEKRPNPNLTVLEWLNGQPGFQNRVAAFAAWDVFPYILNRDRSGIHVRAGWEPMATGEMNPARTLLNQLIAETTPTWESVTYDSFVFRGALDYLLETQPRVLYLALGETDDWAHEGRYDHYLESAHRVDRYLQILWETIQSIPQYKDRTTVLITTDHGRGSGLEDWKSHGEKIPGSEYIWIAAIGPDTRPLGVRRDVAPVTQAQVAATVAAFLGKDFTLAVPAAAASIDLLIAR